MTTYYVSETKGNDNNSGAIEKPFRTISKGIGACINGDTVRVFSGRYYPSFSTRVVVNKSINLIGSGKAVTIIDGSNICEWNTDWKEGLVEIRSDNVTFSGFAVKNVLPGGTGQGASGICVIESNNVTVEKNLVQNIWSSGIQLYGGSSKYGTNYIVRRNEIDRAVNGGDPSIDRQETLSIGNFVNGFEISYNYIHDSGYTTNGNIHIGGEGIDAKDGISNGKIHHNYVYNTRGVGIYLNGYSRFCKDIDVYQNITEKTYDAFESNKLGIGIGIANERSGYTQNINLHNNISYLNAQGFFSNIGDPNLTTNYIKDVYVNKNIMYNNNIDILIAGCQESMSNIRITNNYAHNIYVDHCYQPATVLSGNITDIDSIVDAFNSNYNKLKNDILNRVK